MISSVDNPQRHASVLIPLLVAFVMGPAADARADEASVGREDQFKAAYLFNFMKFVQWPPAASGKATLTVCFVGGDGVYDALSVGIEGKRAGSRRLVALRLEPGAGAGGCDALYLDAASATRRSFEPGLPMLTISDAAAFASRGGMIELFTENNRLRFIVNIDSAQKCGLHISSELLKLAAGVKREAR